MRDKSRDYDKDKLRQLIKDADSVLITAGAGMGVDSGLPDFRGNEGFWKAYPPIAKLGLDFSDMANAAWFWKDPNFAWGFYGHRLHLYRDTIPHEGFKMLLDLVKEKNDDYFVFTSNVDGQFQKAGFSEDKICEIHGTIHKMQCSGPCKDDLYYNDYDFEVDEDTLLAKEYPICDGKNCLKPMRPNILMFNDRSHLNYETAQAETNLLNWLKNIKDYRKKLVVIEIGAGTAIPTVRRFTESTLNYATVIRINPREFHLHDRDNCFEISKGAVEGLRDIL